MSKWQKVFDSGNSFRAQIVCDLLNGEGLEAIVVNKQDSSLNNFGKFEVNVTQDNVMRALNLINNQIDFE